MFGEPVRERLRGLERRELVGISVLAVLILVGIGFWYVRSLPGVVTVEAVGHGPERLPGLAATPSTSPTPASVVVHVAGWVHRPGVYELRQGDRVVDAIRRAGGARAGADLTTINLAAILVDGEQIVVAKVGAGPPSGLGSTVSGGGSTGPGPGGSIGELVNVNTATLDQLEALPGIGPALGQRIIDYREEHGPFASVEDLLNVSGIGEKRLEDLRSKVTV